MNVNESVYGLKENWQSQFFRQNDTENQPSTNKCPSFNTNNYSQLYYGLTNNRISANQPLNLSISYCGLAKDSDSAHRYSIIKNNDNIDMLLAEDDIVNFFFWERTGNSMIFGSEGVLQKSKSWSTDVSSSNINAQISPFCSINVKNQVLGVRVYALNAAKTSGQNFSLDTYKNNYTDFPNVVSVYCKAYNGYHTPRDSDMIHGGGEYGNIKFGMGLLSPYKYSDNTDIYSYAIEQAIEGTTVTLESNMFVVSGSMCVWRYASIGTNYVPVVKTTKISDWNIEFTDENKDRVYIYKAIDSTNIDEFTEECIKQVACYGLYFSPKESVCITGDYTNEDMYIGLLENGLGHGKYLRGANTANAPQNNFDSMNQTQYDPFNPPSYDNTTYTNNTLFQNQLATHSAIKYYVMNAEKVGQLFAKLHDATISNQQTGESITDTNLKTLLTTNGIDVITSFMKFPCEPPTYQGAFGTIHLGTYDTGINANMLGYQTAIYEFTFNRGKKNSLREHFDGSFLDREEYTKAELTIPFCGTVEIPTTYLYQYDDLTVKLIIDFITGTCTAIIMVHDIAIDSISGSCGVQLPVTGVQSASLNAALDSVAKYGKTQERSQGMQLLGGFAAMGLGIATGNIFAAAAGGLTMLNSLTQTANTATQINYELTHMQLPLKQVGGASAAINQTLDMRCKLRISRPVMLDGYDAEIYAKNIGFACLINGVVNDFTGLTMGDICTDGISATTDEKNMIQTLFKTGVIL